MHYALVAATVAAPLRIRSFGEAVSDRSEIASRRAGCKVPCPDPRAEPQLPSFFARALGLLERRFQPGLRPWLILSSEDDLATASPAFLPTKVGR